MVHHPHHRRKLMGGYFTDMMASPRISPPPRPSNPLVCDPPPSAVTIDAGSSTDSSSRTDIPGPMLVDGCDVDTQQQFEKEATRTTTTTALTMKSTLDPPGRWDGRIDGPTGHHQVGEEEEEQDDLWMEDDKVDPPPPAASTFSSSFSSSQSWSSSSFSSLILLPPHDDEGDCNNDNNNNGRHYNGRIRLLRDHVTEHGRQRRDRRRNRQRHHHNLYSPAPSSTSTITTTSMIMTTLGTTSLHTTLPSDTVSASTVRRRRPNRLVSVKAAAASASTKYLAERVLRLIAEENAAFYRAMVDHLLLHNHRHQYPASSSSSYAAALSPTAMESAPMSPLSSSSLSPAMPSLLGSPVPPLSSPSSSALYQHHQQLSPRGVQDEFWTMMWGEDKNKTRGRVMMMTNAAASTTTTTRDGTIVVGPKTSIPSPLTIPSLLPPSSPSSSLLMSATTTLPGGLSSLSRKRRRKKATTTTATIVEDHGPSCCISSNDDGIMPWMVPNLVKTKEGEYSSMKRRTAVKTLSTRPMSSDMTSSDSYQALFPDAKNADLDASSELAACDGYVQNRYYHQYDDEEGTWIWLDDDPTCHQPTVEEEEEEGCCTVVSNDDVADKHLDSDGMAMTMNYPSSIVTTVSSSPLSSKIGDSNSDYPLLPSMGTSITVRNQNDRNSSNINGGGNNVVMSLAHDVIQGLCGWSNDHIPPIMGHIVGWAETMVHGQHR